MTKQQLPITNSHQDEIERSKKIHFGFHRLWSRGQSSRWLQFGLVIVVPFLVGATCSLRTPATDQAQQVVVRRLLDEIIDDILVVTPFATLTPTFTPTLTPTPTFTPTLEGGGAGTAGNGGDSGVPGDGSGTTAGGTGPVVPVASQVPLPLPSVTAIPSLIPTITALPSATLLPTIPPLPSPSPTIDLPFPTSTPDTSGGGGGGTTSPPATSPPPTDTPTPVPPVVSFSTTNYGVSETGSPIANISVVLDKPFGSVITVDYSTSNGSAFAPNDYLASSGTIFFSPGIVNASFNVTVIDDSNDDPDSETVNLTLSNPTNATLGTSNATLTITDDDPLPTIAFDRAIYTTFESQSPVFTVTLSRPSGKFVSFSYGPVLGGTAISGDDYNVSPGVVGFGPDPTGESVTVRGFTWPGLINNDPGIPPDSLLETVVIEITSSPVNLTLATSPLTATLVITDD